MNAELIAERKNQFPSQHQVHCVPNYARNNGAAHAFCDETTYIPARCCFYGSKAQERFGSQQARLRVPPQA